MNTTKIEIGVLPNLWPVIQWLEGGCDPKEAAKELRLYAERIDKGGAPVIASAVPAAVVPDQLARQWSDAYAAFKGAFDNPKARRDQDDEYAQDARRRFRDFDESMRISNDGSVARIDADEPTVEIHIPAYVGEKKSAALVDAVCRAITKHDIEFTRVKLIHPNRDARHAAAELVAGSDAESVRPVEVQRRKATDEEIAEWVRRHDMEASLKLGSADARAAFEDAESLHLTYGVPVHSSETLPPEDADDRKAVG